MAEIEPFVDAQRAADFTGLRRRRLLQMARDGEIPAHTIGAGQRKTWRFRLTELAQAIATGKPCSSMPKKGSIEIGSPRQPNRRN